MKFLETNPELEENKNIQVTLQDYNPVNHKEKNLHFRILKFKMKTQLYYYIGIIIIMYVLYNQFFQIKMRKLMLLLIFCLRVFFLNITFIAFKV